MTRVARPQEIVTVQADGSTRVGLEKWPDAVKELAFELWWMKFHRNAGKVADYLNAMPDQDEDHPADDLSAFNRDEVVDALIVRPISAKTIYSWSRRDKWPEEAEKRHREIAPAIFAQVDHEMELGSIDAMRTLLGIVRDPSVTPLTRLKAADSLLDRTGHTAWVRPSDDGKVAGPQRDYSGTVAGLSTDDLLKQLLGGPEQD